METEILQLTTTEKLALFETTKADRHIFVQQIIDMLEGGEVDPLTIHLQVKAMEDIITRLTSTDEKKNKDLPIAIRYRQLLLGAAEKYPKSFEFNNAKFEVKETGTKYDYSLCGDAEYFELITKQAVLDAKIKAREKFLQTVPAEGLLITSQETGETYTVYPPSKKSTTSLAVSFK